LGGVFFRVSGCVQVHLTDCQDDDNYDDDYGSDPDHDSPVAATSGHPIANAAASPALVAFLCACDAGTGRWVGTASVISVQQADLQFGVPGLASPGLASKIAYSLALSTFLV